MRDTLTASRQGPMSFDLAIADEAKNAFQEYYWYQHWFYGNNNDDILLTVRTRIDQTIFLLQKIMKLLEGFSFDTSEQFLEAQTYIESFYYLAFSTIPLLEFHCDRIDSSPREQSLEPPYFRSLRKKAKGVRNVRNKLIEHPNKPGGLLMWGGLKIDEPGGPVLKFVDPVLSHILLEDENQKDAGLFANSREFYRKVRQCSEQSSKALKASGAQILKKGE